MSREAPREGTIEWLAARIERLRYRATKRIAVARQLKTELDEIGVELLKCETELATKLKSAGALIEPAPTEAKSGGVRIDVPTAELGIEGKEVGDGR